MHTNNNDLHYNVGGYILLRFTMEVVSQSVQTIAFKFALTPISLFVHVSY